MLVVEIFAILEYFSLSKSFKRPSQSNRRKGHMYQHFSKHLSLSLCLNKPKTFANSLLPHMYLCSFVSYLFEEEEDSEINAAVDKHEITY